MTARCATSSSITWLALALFAATALARVDVVHAQDEPAADSARTAPADTAAVTDSATVVPQRDVTDVIRKVINRPVKTEVSYEPRPGLSLTLLPSIGYNPAFGGYVGASIALAGWLGDPKTTLLSSGSIGATYSTSEQISVHFKSDFFLPDNEWALKGDWRYLDTSQETFGLGPDETGMTPYPMDFVLYRLYQTVYRRVSVSSIYVGFGYHFDRYDEIHDERAAQGETTPFGEYSGGTPSRTQSSGISWNVLVDTRDNPINASRGMFWNASLRFFLKAIGSDTDRQSLWSDFRSYTRLPRRGPHVLAIWSYFWSTFGPPPYLDLPAIGWDTYGRSGRGFVQGHIRGENQIYVEFEYRARLTKNGLLGGVTYVNLTGTSLPNGGPFGKLDPGYGVGLRLKFNKKTNTNLVVDAGRGQDTTTRMFFGLQEAF